MVNHCLGQPTPSVQRLARARQRSEGDPPGRNGKFPARAATSRNMLMCFGKGMRLDAFTKSSMVRLCSTSYCRMGAAKS